jgi:hypothetical protein
MRAHDVLIRGGGDVAGTGAADHGHPVAHDRATLGEWP